MFAGRAPTSILTDIEADGIDHIDCLGARFRIAYFAYVKSSTGIFARRQIVVNIVRPMASLPSGGLIAQEIDRQQWLIGQRARFH